MPVALSSARLPALANGLLPFPPLPSYRRLARYPHRPPGGGAAQGWQRAAAGRGDHGRPERQDGRRIGGDQCYDGHKRIKGRKRHLLVDTLGLPLSISVTPASTHDKVGAWHLLAGLTPLVPRLARIWADGAYTSKKLARWCQGYGGWELEIVGRDPDTQGFAVQPRRWVVERSFAWLVRNRRLRIDYERKVQTSETLIEVAMIRLLLRRLAKAA